MATATILNITLTLSPSLLTLLRILPLLGTTASMTHAYMELVTVSSVYRSPPMNSSISKLMLSKTGFVPAVPSYDQARAADAEAVKATGVMGPRWFVSFFNTGVFSVIALNNVTTVSALANLYLFPQGLGAERKLYLLGLGAALGHFLFVPAVSGSVGRLFRMSAEHMGGKQGKESAEGGQAVRELKEWVGAHKIRMSTVDLIAWLSFGVGVVRVLSRRA